MEVGQNNGGSHTIDSAQQAIRGLLSQEREDTQPDESQPEPETEVEEQPETAEGEEPEQPADGEETEETEETDAFSAKWADWQLHQKRLEAIAEAKKKAFEKVAADQTEQFKTYLQGEQAKLLEKVPSWSDAKVARTEKAKLLSYAQENGFSE